MTHQHGRSWFGRWAPLRPSTSQHKIDQSVVKDLLDRGWTLIMISQLLGRKIKEIEPAEVHTEIRNCLACTKPFVSGGTLNRICHKCKKRKD
jgi:hypothetical protein